MNDSLNTFAPPHNTESDCLPWSVCYRIVLASSRMTWFRHWTHLRWFDRPKIQLASMERLLWHCAGLTWFRHWTHLRWIDRPKNPFGESNMTQKNDCMQSTHNFSPEPLGIRVPRLIMTLSHENNKRPQTFLDCLKCCWSTRYTLEHSILAGFLWMTPSNAFLASDRRQPTSRAFIPGHVRSYTSALVTQHPHPTEWTDTPRHEDNAWTVPFSKDLWTAGSMNGGLTMPHPREIASHVSHPLAAGAVAVQTLFAQSAMDKLGDAWSCTMDSLYMIAPDGTMFPPGVPVNEVMMESKLLNDLSHFALDVVAPLCTALFESATMEFRGWTVLGQLLATGAFQVQDVAATAPEQWVIQLVTLFVAFSSLFKHISHMAASQWLSQGCTVSTSAKNYRAFHLLFEPCGMTVHQYNTLSSFAIDWVSLEEGQVIETSPESLFWLYKGSVQVHNPLSKSSYNVKSNAITRKWTGNDLHAGLLGDLDMLGELDFPSTSSSPSLLDGTMTESVVSGILNRLSFLGCMQSEDEDQECVLFHDDSNAYTGESWTVGPGGATVLRVDTQAALSLLKDYDESMEKPLRKILMKGIQSKLGRAFAQASL